MQPRSRFCQTLMVLICTAWPVVGHASVLERVIALIDSAFPQINALNISANIAENAANPTSRDRALARGDQVIIGYGAAGLPVFGTADDFGVMITPAQAASLQTGVSAGLYPVGSALYALPPAGQLSIFAQSASGAVLAPARQTAMTRVDGSITNLLVAVVPAGINTAINAFDSNQMARAVDLDAIASTALGAVNAGEIITHVSVMTGAALHQAGYDLAGLSRGPNANLDLALAGDVLALAHRVSQMGGGVDESTLALNIASNSAEINGRVTNLVQGLNANIGTIVTTALGAVNGGQISD